MVSVLGNTSTDVEKTYQLFVGGTEVWKHLHGRGEDQIAASQRQSPYRNTSTDVEKTLGGDYEANVA